MEKLSEEEKLIRRKAFINDEEGRLREWDKILDTQRAYLKTLSDEERIQIYNCSSAFWAGAEILVLTKEDANKIKNYNDRFSCDVGYWYSETTIREGVNCYVVSSKIITIDREKHRKIKKFDYEYGLEE